MKLEGINLFITNMATSTMPKPAITRRGTLMVRRIILIYFLLPM